MAPHKVARRDRHSAHMEPGTESFLKKYLKHLWSFFAVTILQAELAC